MRGKKRETEAQNVRSGGGERDRETEETTSVETNKQTTTIITNGKASQMLINKDPLDSEVNGLSQGDVVTLHPPS